MREAALAPAAGDARIAWSTSLNGKPGLSW